MHIYKLSLLILLSSIFLNNTIVADAPSCPLCEKIRERNKHLKNEYIYYEDYIKAQEQNKAQPENKEQS